MTFLKRYGPTLTVALVAMSLYLPSLSNGFAFDDERDIRDNPAVVDASDPLEVLLSPYRGAAVPERSPYRPVTSLSYWLNWVTGGDSALPFHAINVLLHGLASALVVHLLLVLGVSTTGALVAGLLFAVHPVHVEAVANMVGRADVLMTVFCLLAAVAFLERGLGRGTRAAIVAVAYAGALGAKENGVVLPALLALLLVPGLGAAGPEGAERERPRRRRELEVLAPTLLVLAAYLAVRASVLGTLVHRDTAPYIAALGSGERFTTAVANLTQVGRLLVAPFDLVADYGPEVIVPVGVGAPDFWLGVVVVVLTGALGRVLWRRQRLGAVAVAWIALSLLVVSNLVFPIGVWVAERTLYLPSVGVALGAAAWVGAVEEHAPLRLGPVWLVTGVLVVVGSWKTLDRIPAWRDTEAVLSTLAEEHPESFRSQWWLARRFTDVGDLDSGLRWFEQARRTSPNDLRLALDHARTLLLAGRPEEAEALVVALPPTDPARFVYLAQSRIMTGRSDEARQDVREGLERFPTDARLQGQAVELGLEPR